MAKKSLHMTQKQQLKAAVTTPKQQQNAAVTAPKQQAISASVHPFLSSRYLPFGPLFTAQIGKRQRVDHERKKAELETMRKDIDNQRDKLVEDAVRKLIEKLPFGVAREFLT